MGCAIWRGAEPHFKLLQSRCKEDEEMIKHVSRVYLPLYEMEDNPQLYVFTARGPDAVNQNSFGFEAPNIYENI